VIALLAMDAPTGSYPESVRREKLRLFHAMRPLEYRRARRFHRKEGVRSKMAPSIMRHPENAKQGLHSRSMRRLQVFG
jgi:glucose-6-phosphate 1-dehydrogenase